MEIVMTKLQKITTSILSIFLCLLFIVSVVDTHEFRQKTNFDQERILAHVAKLSENGPRSVAHKEANAKAIEYIASEVASYGAVNEDTVEKPAYLIQSFTAKDTRYQNWYLDNVIVHIPANAENKTGDAVMFMGHTDSVPMGNGASDDGVACAVMLEAIRYYLDKMENGYTLENDLVFCFVNGEEYGLYGSEAFAASFHGFDDVKKRIKFVTNLESRGTDGTLIMFETAKNNYNTVKLFSEVNENIFTCSIATLVYDTMPNSTDFTTFKNTTQGLNMANITGGENYHTQNDRLENIAMSYLSQQAQIVDGLIEKLGSYELTKLYEAEESAVFFSYLNLTTVVYDHTAAIILAVLCLLLVLTNIVLGIVSKKNNLAKTAKAFVALAAGLVLSAGAAYVCYYVFQLIAALAGVIDVHMIGTISYSNTAIVIGLAILSLAMTVLTTHFSCKWLKIERRDMLRAFAYLHATLGIALSFVLADASYLFIFSGILLMVNEVLSNVLEKKGFAGLHFELLATALYFPIVIPVLVLATSALGLSMAYVYGLVFALAIFALGITLTPACAYLSVRLFGKKKSVSPAEGALHILAAALAIFLCVSFIKPNASVNLQGKQNIVKLPYDDALVYVLDASGDSEYRIYDLNAYGALKEYAPEMDWAEEYYVGNGEEKEIDLSIQTTIEKRNLHVKKAHEDSLVYLYITCEKPTTFSVNDGKSVNGYQLKKGEEYAIKLHSDCTVTIHGAATIRYQELFIDYAPLIPAAYANDSEQLHFNLWLTDTFTCD
jgi:hypothetical protein